ncbi:hypothetical protein MVEN_02349700 [Mycena venus]|uniref:Uncharacterized protein n=1 Tax=Mycena venus TaxID=2733690 RepID=A0A8H6X334_9AGAR|nr:hypothetical protein MVEN_02349700 [Mycena venus]
MRPASSASSTSPLPRHVTSHLVSACEPMLRERRVTELQFADHSLSPHVEQPRLHRVSELKFTDHSISPCVKQRHSAPIKSEVARNPLLRHTRSPSTMSLHPRRVTSRLVFAISASAERPDPPVSPHIEQRHSASIKPELAHAKPRSRRCFVCGTTGRHPLDFRVCPRTAVLLRRSLAKINEHGRLVSFDGSPLPMTRHPGGVAVHIISRFRNPMRFLPELPKPSPAPIAHIPQRPVSVEPRDHVPSPLPTFNSSSPHAIPPIELIAPAPEHVPLRRVVSSHDPVLSRARASFVTLLLEFLLNSGFRSQLRAILTVVDNLSMQDPSTLRERLQPVFTRISHFIPAT